MTDRSQVQTRLIKRGYPFKLKLVKTNYYHLYQETPGMQVNNVGANVVAKGVLVEIDRYLDGFEAGIAYANKHM